MNNTANKTIWTIGHSTLSLSDFVSLLESFDIQILVDIRSYPGSRRFPHFNKENLEKSLPANGITYLHIKELGGRRKVNPASKNNGWRLDAFRAYADYMETDSFKNAIIELEGLAYNTNTAYMCAEALWWRCHRSLVSDFLLLKGWSVFHIMSNNKLMEHTYTSPARIEFGKLTYPKEPEF